MTGYEKNYKKDPRSSLRASISVLAALLLTLLLSMPAFATVNDLGIHSVSISPANPSVGDIVTIQGKTIPNSNVVLGLDFTCDLPVNNGKYEYAVSSILLSSKARYTVSAQPVETMKISGNFFNIFPLITVNALVDGNGKAQISRVLIPGIWTLKASGNARSTASSVSMCAQSTMTLKTGPDGTFMMVYNTNSLPQGQFNFNIKNIKGYTYQDSVTLN